MTLSGLPRRWRDEIARRGIEARPNRSEYSGGEHRDRFLGPAVDATMVGHPARHLASAFRLEPELDPHFVERAFLDTHDLRPGDRIGNRALAMHGAVERGRVDALDRAIRSEERRVGE